MLKLAVVAVACLGVAACNTLRTPEDAPPIERSALPSAPLPAPAGGVSVSSPLSTYSQPRMATPSSISPAYAETGNAAAGPSGRRP